MWYSETSGAEPISWPSPSKNLDLEREFLNRRHFNPDGKRVMDGLENTTEAIPRIPVILEPAFGDQSGKEQW